MAQASEGKIEQTGVAEKEKMASMSQSEQDRLARTP